MTNYTDMKINIGGMLRCCIDTVDNLDPDREYCDGKVIDCIHEPKGNGAIVVKDGIFCWNKEGRKSNGQTTNTTGR